MELICREYHSTRTISVRFAGGRASPAYCEDDEASLLLAPVFFDLQINGYGGVDFSSPAELTPEGIKQIARALSAQGVGYFLPTVITGSFETIVPSLETIAAARKDPLLAVSIPGIHLEGPYISPENGPRGAHPLEHCKVPSWEEFSRLQKASGGLIKLVTLAPELPGAISFIERLRNEGILAAIGHTAAEPEDIAAAVRAGAMLSTHLGNGAHARLKRHPNYIWEQLAEDALWASLIVDGHHLPPAVVKVMVRAKGAKKCILISDAVAVAGLPAGRYSFAGKPVELTPQGRVQLIGTQYLAGSTLRLPDAIANAVRFAGIEPATALEMASRQPSLLFKATGIELDVYSSETFTVLRDLEVVATVVAGDVRYLDENSLPG